MRAHPAYAHDSVVSAPIAYDLLREAAALGAGERASPALLGEEAARYVEAAAAATARGGAASSAASTAAAGGAAGGRHPPAAGVRMRGKSFAEEVHERAAGSALVRALVERYTLTQGRAFADVPAFLSSSLTG